MLYDISLALGPALAVWPGDAPFRFELTWERAAGDSVNVGAVTMSVHTGTHVDAPFHFEDCAAPVDALDLNTFLGPARVLDVSGHAVIGREHIPADLLSGCPRLLLRTGAWENRTRFPERIPVLAGDVPDYLRACGVRLFGIDVPSVDAIDSPDLPIHRALAAAGIAILESVCLAGVPPGVFELIALPLKLAGADGSPVRAVLRDTPGD